MMTTMLIARKSEMMDGVIPASNSVMARNLKKLGLLFDNEGYLEVSAQLLRNIAAPGQVQHSLFQLGDTAAG
jgi:uncharacterized protein YyaL (SSP411 family)